MSRWHAKPHKFPTIMLVLQDTHAELCVLRRCKRITFFANLGGSQGSVASGREGETPMATVYFFDRAHTAEPSSVRVLRPAPKPVRKGWFRRFIDTVLEARMRQALREIERHNHLMPDELERAGDKLSERNED